MILARPTVSDPAGGLLIVVPAFNEAGGIGPIIDEIRAAEPAAGVLVVDDGSTDSTSSVARRHGARVASLPYNLGIGGAVQTGFRHAREAGIDLVVQVDADGQHVPAAIPLIVAPILRGEADVVVGSRFLDVASYRSEGSRRIGIRLLSWLAWRLTKCRVHDATSGFRAYNRAAIELVADHYPTDYPEAEVLVTLAREGLRIAEVGVEMRPRAFGRSSIGTWRSVHYMVKVVLAMMISVLRKRLRTDGTRT